MVAGRREAVRLETRPGSCGLAGAPIAGQARRTTAPRPLTLDSSSKHQTSASSVPHPPPRTRFRFAPHIRTTKQSRQASPNAKDDLIEKEAPHKMVGKKSGRAQLREEGKCGARKAMDDC
jgi:hypothetical protein